MKHYPLMKDAELLDMRSFIDTLAADNCALFMWATYPRLDFSVELLKGWGFRYATVAFTWVKTRRGDAHPVYGPGFYTASNPEIVLLGVRGSVPPVRKMHPSVIQRPRGEHSRKPDDIHRAIDQMYPDSRKIELFARRPYPGWDAWGNQIDLQVGDPSTVCRDLPEPQQLRLIS